MKGLGCYSFGCSLSIFSRFSLGAWCLIHLLVLVSVYCCTHTVVLTSSSLGSILVACAHYGGYVLGADIDRNLLHGRGGWELVNVFSLLASLGALLLVLGYSSRGGAKQFRGRQ